jgi:hypothetical protein
MKNKFAIIGLFVVALIALSFSVSAWHCLDSEQVKPPKNWTSMTYGPWGDNGVLGGETWGYYNRGVVLPEGCTQTGSYQAECADICIEGTLREFYCTDRPRYTWETIIQWTDYENSNECSSNEVPEFGAIGAAIVVVGALGFLIFRKK